MSDVGRVVTAKLPEDLVNRMDEISVRIDRSKSWIVREAVSHWLIEEQRRFDLTQEAMNDIDEGRTISNDDILAMVEARKQQRREEQDRSAA